MCLRAYFLNVPHPLIHSAMTRGNGPSKIVKKYGEDVAIDWKNVNILFTSHAGQVLLCHHHHNHH